MEAKGGLTPDESEVDMNSHKLVEDQEVGSQTSLSALKLLSITTLSDDLGVNSIIKKPTSIYFYDPKQNEVFGTSGLYLPLRIFLL